MVHATLLYFDGCPNWRSVDAGLREALRRLGREDVVVERRRMASPAQAEKEGMRGSPTILIDGHDPFAGDATSAGMACRLYAIDAGARGAPTVERLMEVLDG